MLHEGDRVVSRHDPVGIGIGEIAEEGAFRSLVVFDAGSRWIGNTSLMLVSDFFDASQQKNWVITEHTLYKMTASNGY